MKAPYRHIYRYLLTVLLMLVFIPVFSQEFTVDSLDLPIGKDTVSSNYRVVVSEKDSVKIYSMAKEVRKQAKDWTTWRPDPKRAMWLALVLPGAGQIYNRKYWKLPIVYGGFVGCAYAMRWNNQMFMDYSQAYADIMDDDQTTNSYEKFLHLGAAITPNNIDRYKNIFKQRKDRYRRWRDLSFFCMLGVYAISVIDAYVDASLSQFDISDDLSLHIEPGIVNNNRRALQKDNVGIGINCSLNF